ncbi:hypothetical protein J2M53_14370 [Arthrobacter sp. zg-ZUI100]|uniref:hypothetical protein n=1 Tax=Arthrobacter jiangjiafuii TaxID=2817475 RepID=UPI001AEE3E02|nr:hypothetical protein [Arthrobacter jiangjiafuii]MBP3037431.1 hypothetical protein [Arthrobacter jiangjiafuii]
MDWLAPLNLTDFTAPEAGLLLGIGLALGIALGIALGWSIRAGIDKRDESAALKALITDLHLKRPLAPIEPQIIESAGDEARCRRSVLDARDRILETLAHLRTGSPNTDVLMRLAAACTLYLREATRAPELYQFALMDLRETMVDGVKLLSDGRRRVRYLSPGERPPGKTGKAGRPAKAGKFRYRRTPSRRW